MSFSSAIRNVMRPLLQNLTPDRSLNMVITNVAGGGIPVLVPWGTALGLAGAWLVWPGLTPNFRQENRGEKAVEDYTEAEENRAYAYRPFNVKNQ